MLLADKAYPADNDSGRNVRSMQSDSALRLYLHCIVGGDSGAPAPIWALTLSVVPEAHVTTPS